MPAKKTKKAAQKKAATPKKVHERKTLAKDAPKKIIKAPAAAASSKKTRKAKTTAQQVQESASCNQGQTKTSLGQFDQYELERMYSFLSGIPWEEQFDYEDGTLEPWLVEWADTWNMEPLYTIDETGPYSHEGFVIHDASVDEYWFLVAESEGPNVFAQIPNPTGLLTPESTWPVVADCLESLGSFLLGSHFAIHDTYLLPVEPMRGLLMRLMAQSACTTLAFDENLTLDVWIKREYGMESIKSAI
jgi:hypothetical protein